MPSLSELCCIFLLMCYLVHFSFCMVKMIEDCHRRFRDDEMVEELIALLESHVRFSREHRHCTDYQKKKQSSFWCLTYRACTIISCYIYEDLVVPVCIRLSFANVHNTRAQMAKTAIGSSFLYR